MCVSLTAEAKYYCLCAGSQEDSEDQAKLIVGIVAGLLIAAAMVGLIYWLYMKNSRYGNTTFAFDIYILSPSSIPAGTVLASLQLIPNRRRKENLYF